MSIDWFTENLGWNDATGKTAERCVKYWGQPVGPNLADLGDTASTLIAGAVYRLLGVPLTQRDGFDFGQLERPDDAATSTEVREKGNELEKGLERDLRTSLQKTGLEVSRTKKASEYAQYRHLELWQKALKSNPGLEIYSASDYTVKTDVMVGVPDPTGPDRGLLLHAAVSSKLTLRSDRAQNVRTEFNMLIRNRRGRLPHLVVVTAEPRPSRLTSLTRGTGEIDTTYHLLFDEMQVALADLASQIHHHARTQKSLREQKNLWDQMVEGMRIRPYRELAQVLAST